MSIVTKTKQSKTNVAKLNVGDHLSESVYSKVVKKDMKFVYLETNSGQKYKSSHDLVAAFANNATQFTDTKYVTREDIIHVIRNTNGTVFSVTFNKKVTHKEIADAVSTFIGEGGIGRKTAKSSVEPLLLPVLRKAMKGEARTLVCYLPPKAYNVVEGRFQVYDLEADCPKQVDQRTISSVIYDNVKYIVADKKTRDKHAKGKKA